MHAKLGPVPFFNSSIWLEQDHLGPNWHLQCILIFYKEELQVQNNKQYFSRILYMIIQSGNPKRPLDNSLAEMIMKRKDNDIIRLCS